MNGCRDSDAFLREVNRWIDPGSVRVVIDAGTLDGADALALAAHFPAAVVYAFECNPAAVIRCRERLRNAERVHLIEAAVSEKDGEADFYAIDPHRTMTPHADGNIGASSLFRASGLYPHERYIQNVIRVRTVRLDTWAAAAGVSSIDILWLDLQGAELLALRGLGRLIETVRVIHTEAEFRPMYEGQPLFPEVDRFLRRSGFRREGFLYRDEWFGNVVYTRQPRGRLGLPALLHRFLGQRR